MKRILILSSSYTGHGHASIAQSIIERLDDFGDVKYRVVEGFSLAGNGGAAFGKLYGPVTRSAPGLWHVGYEMASRNLKPTNRLTAALIRRRFLKVLSQFRPDLILTVHPIFNGSILDILDSCGIDIPVIVMQADLVNVRGGWCEPDSRLTLCPTREAYECSLRLGMPEEKLRLVGFPCRSRFTEAARSAEPRTYRPGQTVQCLLMSGGEGSGNIIKYAGELLETADCRVSVICGRNEKLRRRLLRELKPVYGGRIRAFGFQDNIHEHMLGSDIIIARGSPNTLMEAVVMNVPLIITGSLPGQETDNPPMMVSHNLGVICENPGSISSVVGELLRDGGRRLEEIRAAQRAYRDLDAAKNIAALIREEVIAGGSGSAINRQQRR